MSKTRTNAGLWIACRALLFAVVVITPYVALGIDGGHLLTWFVLGPIVTIYLFGAIFTSSGTDRWRGNVLTFLLYMLVVGLFLFRADGVRTSVRWLFARREYKAKVLEQPVTGDGSLKHVEWDGSGFAGVAVNVIYVVYDPSDALKTAAGLGEHGKFPGLPCDVYRVRKLERQWYSVEFYTDKSWYVCASR